MDVYLVPVGAERCELYCESTDEPGVVQPDASGGLRKRLMAMFRLNRLMAWFATVLAAVERQHPDHGAAPPPSTFWSKQRVRLMRWLAEKVAEQRLLWRLRGRHTVQAFYPSGQDEARALEMIRSRLASDVERHRWWLVVDGIGMVASSALMFFPGPNLPGYYFTFRVVGHFMALRGARQGLNVVVWEMHADPRLAEIATLSSLAPAERRRRLQAIGNELGLARLARFVERTVPGTA